MIKPTLEFLLVEPVKPELERDRKTSGGLEVATRDTDRLDLIVARGTVISVGGKLADIKAGDTVYYNYFAGNTLLIHGKDALGKEDKELHFIHYEDILGVEVSNGTK